jgi:hypothetical protein
MSARNIILAATACTLFSAAGAPASSADAAVRLASGLDGPVVAERAALGTRTCLDS